jgi:hypothetical protein
MVKVVRIPRSLRIARHLGIAFTVLELWVGRGLVAAAAWLSSTSRYPLVRVGGFLAVLVVAGADVYAASSGFAGLDADRRPERFRPDIFW